MVQEQGCQAMPPIALMRHTRLRTGIFLRGIFLNSWVVALQQWFYNRLVLPTPPVVGVSSRVMTRLPASF